MAFAKFFFTMKLLAYIGETDKMTTKRIRIAIDGPAAAGKSTVAKNIAKRLSFVYIDTGAMYRALTLKALQENVDIKDEASLVQLLQTTKIELLQSTSNQKVLLDGRDVTEEIRKESVSNAVSFVAEHARVREALVKKQRELAENDNVVMDGRDIGTHVLPEAELKVFLIASVEERAKRRHKENVEKGYESDLNKLIEEIKERDERDSNRKTSPLVQAEDAIAIDTTSLSIEEVEEKILQLLNQVME